MPSLRTVGMAVLFPIYLGAVIIAYKHYLLKVPKIGFVLHALAGGPIPPYMDDSIMKVDDEWLRAKDVVVSVPVKAGTTWTLYTVHMLRYKGNPPPFRDIYEETAWTEFVFYPGQPLDERVERIRNVSRQHASTFNILKTHVSPPKLRLRDDVRYIFVFRNIFDMVASGYDFTNNHSPDFARMWGGFPPGAGDPEPMPWPKYEHMLMEDGGDGKPLIGQFLFDALLNWWPHRHKPNVLFVHYNDRIKDDKAQIRRMAEFLGIPLTGEELDRVTHLVSFKELKQVESKMEGVHVLKSYKSRGLIPDEVEALLLSHERKGTMLNKGPNRSGKEELPESLRKKIEVMLDQTLTPRIRDWVLHGGDLPVDDELKRPFWP